MFGDVSFPAFSFKKSSMAYFVGRGDERRYALAVSQPLVVATIVATRFEPPLLARQCMGLWQRCSHYLCSSSVRLSQPHFLLQLLILYSTTSFTCSMYFTKVPLKLLGSAGNISFTVGDGVILISLPVRNLFCCYEVAIYVS